MAANEYYHPSPDQTNHHRLDTPLPPSPDPYTSYNPNLSHPSVPYSPTHSSAPYEDTSYRPYGDLSQQSIPSPYYASGGGGREHEPNPYSDDIPLRQHPSKGNSEMMLHDPLPDDPAIIDGPQRSRKGRNAKKPFFARKQSWVVYALTLIQVVVFIAELAKNGTLTGSPIQTKPSFNPMIGPSYYVLINMGARFVPCMRYNESLITEEWRCPNTTTNSATDPSNNCQLNQLCGFGDGAYTSSSPPHQWFRFITPIFMHAGIIHIAFNMLLQLLIGREMELLIGPIRFIIVYLCSGIFGFVLGGNLAPQGIVSTGASGALFGIMALVLLDLLYHWAERRSPWTDLAWILIDVVISFVLGLLPGLDNFSHIGGFLMGLVLGICLLNSPEPLRQRVGADLPPYASVKAAQKGVMGGFRGFVKGPVGFFKGRKSLWWAWWLVRALALIGVLVSFIVLVKNFYKTNPTKCHWCRYLSCLDINHWCDLGNLPTTNVTTNGTSPSKRDLDFGPIPISLKDLL